MKMVLGELLSLTNLSEAHVFCIHKMTKIVVVYEDTHFVLAAFQIVMPYLKSFDNS